MNGTAKTSWPSRSPCSPSLLPMKWRLSGWPKDWPESSTSIQKLSFRSWFKATTDIYQADKTPTSFTGTWTTNGDLSSEQSSFISWQKITVANIHRKQKIFIHKKLLCFAKCDGMGLEITPNLPDFHLHFHCPSLAEVFGKKLPLSVL